MVSRRFEASVFTHRKNVLLPSVVLAFLVLAVVGTSAAGTAEKSSAAIENTLLFVPASAHVAGALDTNWRTDLQIYNPGQGQASVTVALLEARESNHSPQTRTYTLDPGESLRFEDALMSIFGFDGAAALRVINTQGMASVTSRTYNLTDGGTYGQFVGGVIDHTAIQGGQEGRLIQLTHNRSTTSGFRTNIGFVNSTGSAMTVNAAMYRGDGTYLGTRSYNLAPYEFRQVDKIFQKVTSGDVNDGYAVLSTSTPGGAFFAYAAVVDNVSSDPIYITPSIRASGAAPPSPTPTPTGTTTPTATPTPTPTATPTPTSTPSANPNLAPYGHTGWSGPLVVSGVTGTNTSGGLSGSGSTYFDWGVANYGPGSVTFQGGETIARILLDDQALVSFYYSDTDPYTLEENQFASYQDYQVDAIGAGQHTASLVADPDNVIAEQDEGDNRYDYTDTWSAKAATREIRVPVPKAAMLVGSIPGWARDGVTDRREPVGIRWQGAPPLKPGPVSLTRTKAMELDTSTYIPAAAHASGALDTNWRTDVQLHNPGATQARVQIDLLVRDQSNPTPQSQTFLIPAGASLRYEDIMASNFGANGAAALRLTTLEGDVIATSRTYNLTSNGTYGQYGGSVHGMEGFVTGERALLMQLTHSSSANTGFRTNVGMINLTGQTIILDLSFYDENGTLYGTKSYDLGPYEYIQKDKIFKRVTSENVDDGYIHITSPTSGARYLAYATVIDNETGDSVFIPATSILEAEPTPASFIPIAETVFTVMGMLGQDQIPSIESMVGMIQTYGIEGAITSAAALLPPGMVTIIPNGARIDLGSHHVAQTGDILAGAAEGTYSNLVNEPGEISYDFQVGVDNVLVNGQYIGIDGATGDVDLTVDNDSHVRGGATMNSFQDVMTKNNKLIPDIDVTGEAEWDTSICENYPIDGYVTVTIDGEAQTIEFTPECDGTFIGGSLGQTGDVSFRLTWATAEDLDLYVKEPNGEIIYFAHRTSATNGQLDVDSNAGCRQDANPTENVFWPEGAAPEGTYEFWVELWSDCDQYGGTSTPNYTLRVFEGETVVRTFNHTMPSGGLSQTYTHTYSP